MTWFGISITYAVSWWLVLFMVLPWQVRVAENPGAGHARSAPVNPRLRKKLLITSLLTLIPTFVFYIVISEAKAAERDIYKTEGATSDVYRTKNATGDVYSTKHAGEGCKPATMKNDSASVPVNIAVPISPYYDSSHQGSAPGNANNAVASQGALGLGQGQVNSDGSLTVNGKRIGAPDPVGDCPPDASDDAKTK